MTSAMLRRPACMQTLTAAIARPSPRRELAALQPHVPEIHHRVQETAGRGAAQAGPHRHLAETELRVLGVEGADHGQAALQRLNEVCVANAVIAQRDS